MFGGDRLLFFFFQAEDGIRDRDVTGVQTCALPILPAIRPDLAIIHAQRADRAGNVLIEGITGVQKEVVLAAKRAIVTVEEVVDDRSEERRVGKECRYRGAPEHEKKKEA